MPLFTSRIDESREILRDALFSSDVSYKTKAVDFFSVQDTASTNPWVIPFIALNGTESVLLEDGAILDKTVSKAAIIKTEQSASGNQRLVAGFLNASGDRVWLPVKSITLNNNTQVMLGFREVYIYYGK